MSGEGLAVADSTVGAGHRADWAVVRIGAEAVSVLVKIISGLADIAGIYISSFVAVRSHRRT